MKNLIVILYIFLALSSSAQPPAGSIFYNPNLDKFEGTWIWNDGSPNNEITLKLKKVMYFKDVPSGGYYDEVLLVCHKYVKSGIIMEDNLSLYSTLGQNQIGSAVLSPDNESPLNNVWGLFTDATLNKNEYLELTYHTTAVPSLEWYLHTGDGSYKIGQTPPSSTTTLPENLLLVKQP